jgi:hypothetical protein
MPNTSYELFPSTGFRDALSRFGGRKKSLDLLADLGGKVVMDNENVAPCVVSSVRRSSSVMAAGRPTITGVYLPPKDGAAVSASPTSASRAPQNATYVGNVWVEFSQPKVPEAETGATCAIPTATSLKSARRKSSGESRRSRPGVVCDRRSDIRLCRCRVLFPLAAIRRQCSCQAPRFSRRLTAPLRSRDCSPAALVLR